MAQYRLQDKYDEKQRISLEDLDIYWTKKRWDFPNAEKLAGAIAANRQVSTFLSKHGFGTSDVVLVKDKTGAVKTWCPEKFCPLDKRYPKEKIFSYLQLLEYILELSAERSMSIRSLLALFENPAKDNIPLYDKTLQDLADFISNKEKNRPEDIINRADAVWTAHEFISWIAYCIFHDYEWSIHDLRLNVGSFIDQLKKRRIPELPCTNTAVEKSYLDGFYRIVATARVCAEVNEVLTASMEVKNEFLIGHPAKGEYQRMVQPMFCKVEEDDRRSLAYENGVIRKVTGARMDLLNSPPPDNQYMDALKKYIEKDCASLTKKIFCTDNADRAHMKRVIRHINDVFGYWMFEKDRYENHGTLSNAKLISLFQVIFLSEKKAGFTDGKKHTTKTRDNRGHGEAMRESRDYSAVFNEFEETDQRPNRLTYRNSYIQQKMCKWVDYQTLVNTAPTEYAEYYLDINIAALDSILDGRETASPALIQAKAEQMLHYAVLRLIRNTNNLVQISELYSAIKRKFTAKVTHTEKFRANAELHQIGCFCRLFGVETISAKIIDAIQNANRSGQFSVTLNPYCPKIEGFRQLHLQFMWNQENSSLCFEDIIFC